MRAALTAIASTLFAIGATLVYLLVSAPASFAQTPASGSRIDASQARDVGPPPATLADAIARGEDRPGWRTRTLADGRTAAVGVTTTGTLVIGIACSSGARPEIAALARRAVPLPQSLVVEKEDTAIAFPIDPAGRARAGGDALVTRLMFAGTGVSGIWLDDVPLPTNGARDALREVEKDCERAGWDYGNDDESQLAWILSTPHDRPLSLSFGKPWTGWLLVDLACGRSGALVVKPAILPRRTKSGQSVNLTIEVDGQKVSMHARAERFSAGDIAGFLIARFERPQPFLRSLRHAKTLTFRTQFETLTIPARGIGSLLPRLRIACGF